MGNWVWTTKVHTHSHLWHWQTVHSSQFQRTIGSYRVLLLGTNSGSESMPCCGSREACTWVHRVDCACVHFTGSTTAVWWHHTTVAMQRSTYICSKQHTSHQYKVRTYATPALTQRQTDRQTDRPAQWHKNSRIAVYNTHTSISLKEMLSVCSTVSNRLMIPCVASGPSKVYGGTDNSTMWENRHTHAHTHSTYCMVHTDSSSLKQKMHTVCINW